MNPIFFLAAALQAAAPAPAPATFVVEIQGLRSQHGLLQACMTANRAHFPDCSGDPRAIRMTVPASAGRFEMKGLAPGRYALSLIHDENSNNKLDTMAGIPREGFGFSRSPKVHFGPPKFDKVAVDLAPGLNRATVKMQYLL